MKKNGKMMKMKKMKMNSNCKPKKIEAPPTPSKSTPK